MTKEELIALLRALASDGGDQEEGHRLADDAILEYLADDEIRQAFDAIPKWYA